MNPEETQISRWINLASDISVRLTGPQISKLVTLLSENQFKQPTRLDLEKIGISPSTRKWLWRKISKLDSKEAIVTLVVALEMDTKKDFSRDIEICWTGPKDIPDARKTWPALSELILSAKKSITIVGYSITPGMKDIMGYLKEKSRDGIQLNFMIDRLGEKKKFLSWIQKLPMPPKLYSRPHDATDPMSSLHIKCVVIDDNVVMLGSANPTYHGTIGNFELGVIIRNKRIVNKIVKLLDGLRTELVLFEIQNRMP